LPLGLRRPRGYISSMSGFLAALLIVAMLATLAVLFMGILTMARGGEFGRKHSNRLMRWRVVLQATAVLLFLLLAFVMQR